MELQNLVGKTIIKVALEKEEKFDDIPYLHFYFDDNTEYWSYATYGGYTGESVDEYPAYIRVTDQVPRNSDWWDIEEPGKPATLIAVEETF